MKHVSLVNVVRSAAEDLRKKKKELEGISRWIKESFSHAVRGIEVKGYELEFPGFSDRYELSIHVDGEKAAQRVASLFSDKVKWAMDGCEWSEDRKFWMISYIQIWRTSGKKKWPLTVKLEWITPKNKILSSS